MNIPITNGRKQDGTFAQGNPGGSGNPFAAQVNKLRSVMLKCVSEKKMKNVVSKLVEMAESGDLKAIELLLTRTLGRPTSDSAGPTVAVQVNNQQPMSDDERRAVTRAIVERLRSARALEASAEDP